MMEELKKRAATNVIIIGFPGDTERIHRELDRLREEGKLVTFESLEEATTLIEGMVVTSPTVQTIVIDSVSSHYRETAPECIAKQIIVEAYPDKPKSWQQQQKELPQFLRGKRRR